MRRKLTLWAVAMATVLNLGLALAAPVLACTCSATEGGSCSGECCKASGGGCICGPCDKILK